MPHFSHAAIPLPDVSEDDLRLGHFIGRARPAADGALDQNGAESVAVIVGFPSDAGVVINGGRAGASGGPIAIRDRLYRLTPDARDPVRFVNVLERTTDLGDLALGERIDADQEALGETLAPFIRDGIIPIVLGGGHETAFGHFLGHVYAGREVGVLNWDAHPDVRPLRDGRPHSGSPFRQMLTHISGSCSGYTVAGLLPHQVSAAHVDWIIAHEGEVIWRDNVTISGVTELYGSLTAPTMVSFDMDAVDGASAPGVSAPATGGLDAGTWLHAAYEAGRSAAVISMDIVELNPAYDPDGRTARLAALTVWTFLRGLSERIGG